MWWYVLYAILAIIYIVGVVGLLIVGNEYVRRMSCGGFGVLLGFMFMLNPDKMSKSLRTMFLMIWILALLWPIVLVLDIFLAITRLDKVIERKLFN